MNIVIHVCFCSLVVSSLGLGLIVRGREFALRQIFPVFHYLGTIPAKYTEKNLRSKFGRVYGSILETYFWTMVSHFGFYDFYILSATQDRSVSALFWPIYYSQGKLACATLKVFQLYPLLSILHLQVGIKKVYKNIPRRVRVICFLKKCSMWNKK